jgi:uncharacterized repeat protein (TIGR01451 family)
VKTSMFFARTLGALLLLGLCSMGLADATVTVNKTFTPGTVNIGGTSLVTVTLQNTDTTADAQVTSFLDDIGATMGGKAILSTTGVDTASCLGADAPPAPPVPTLNGVTNQVTMGAFAIPTATSVNTPATCTISFDVIGDQAGNGMNQIRAGDVVMNPTSLNPDPITQTLTVNGLNATVTSTGNQTTLVAPPATATNNIVYTIHNPAVGADLTNASFQIAVNSVDAYSISGITNTCGATLTTAEPFASASGNLQFTGGDIPANGSCTVTLPVSAAVQAVVNTTFTANLLIDNQLVTNPTSVGAVQTFSLGQPTLGKSFNPSTIQPAGNPAPAVTQSTMTITMFNPFTSQPQTNVGISDTMPPNITIVGSTGTTTCGGTITISGAQTIMTLAGATIPANSTCTITVPVQATASATNTVLASSYVSTEDPTAGAVANRSATLTVTGAGGDFSTQKLANGAGSASVGVNVPVQFTLRFASIAGSVFTGGTFSDNLTTVGAPMVIVENGTTNTFAFTNCGPAPAISDPNGGTLVTGSNLQIATGSTCQVTFWAEFTTTTGSAIPGTNTATGVFGGISHNLTANVTELPTLTVSNYLASNQGLVNQPLTVSGAITDTSGTTDTNAVAVFNLNQPGHHNVVLDATPNFGFTGCPAGVNASSIQIDASREFFTLTVPAPGTIGATCTVNYDVINEVAGAAGAGTFTAGNSTYAGTLTGNAAIPSTGTNSVQFSTSNITTSKVFVPNNIQAGAPSQVQIGLSVAGVFPGAEQTIANNVTFPDTLPTGITFSPTPNPAFSGCGVSPAAVIAGSTITFSNITLVANGATSVPCTVSFNVTSSIVGAPPANSIPASSVTTTSAAITNALSVSASLTVVNGIAVQKTFVSPTLPIGSTDFARFLLSNSAATTPIVGSLTDHLPSNLELTSTTLGGLQPGDAPLGLCGGSVTAGTVGAGGAPVTLSGLTVPAYNNATHVPGQCVVYLALGASSTGLPGTVATNTINGGDVVLGGIANLEPSTATSNLTAAPSVTVSKAFNPIMLAGPGATSVLTITVTNTSANAALLNGMSLTDPLPVNVVNAPTPAASTTCAGGTVTAVAGGSTVTLNNGSVSANASCTITVTVTSSAPGIWTNTIPAGAITTNQGATNAAPATALLNVGNVSGVGITKAFSPIVIAPGGTSVLTITLLNTATTTVPLTAVGVTDTLPANVTVAATPNAATTCGGTATATAGGSTVTLAGGAMAINGTCTITVNVTGTVPGTYTNTINAGSIGDTQGATDAAPAVSNITIGQPTLVVAKTSVPSSSTVSPGQSIAYSVTVVNNGTQPETNTKVTDVLGNATLTPGTVTVNGVSFPDAVITAAAPFGTLAIGATDTITYSATVNTNAAIGAMVTNTATIGGDQPCSSGTCSSTSPSNTIAPPVLAATKTIDNLQTEPVVAGQVVTYGIGIANSGTGPAINTMMTDQVPSGMTVVPGSATVNTVSAPGATLIGQTYTIPVGTVAAGTTAAVAFKATVGATAGNPSNTVSVLATGMSRAVQSNAALAHQVPAAIAVTKTTPSTTVSTGDRANFTITATPVGGIAYGLTTIVDTLPDYEVYAPGTSRVDGKAQEPAVAGHMLTWTVPSLTAPLTITYATAIAPGAQANTTLTNVVNVTAVAPGSAGFGRGAATAAVLVVGSTFGSCYPITGRVYLDVNGSGRFQDPDVGLHSVHIYLDDGESVVTDSTGRYDFPCVDPGMHALRLDATTLPAGIVPYDDRNIDSEKSTRRLVHHIFDTYIIEDINFAVTGTPEVPLQPGGSGSH